MSFRSHLLTNDFIDHPDKQCKGKHGYGSKAKAKRVIRRRGDGGTGILRAYRCPHCDLFHIGHRERRI